MLNNAISEYTQTLTLNCHLNLILSKETKTRMKVKLYIAELMMILLYSCLHEHFACNDDDDCKFTYIHVTSSLDIS